MKAEFVNPFLMATQDVFDRMLGLRIEKGKIELKEDLIAGKDANVLISIVGSLLGAVVYSFPKTTALEIVRIMSGMEIDALDIFVTSALGEVGNIISGNAVSYLEKADYWCNIAPPQIILGENKSVSVAAPKSLLVPIKTKAGDFEISIALKENPNA
ncbi:chemotaxis protein CheX [Carboxydothermus pertinax]|uniref:CheC domain protein n=1 Tax=Carboxydothermus pertinax TaxID=870242 RepID=A0A1L8CRF7_9THEO|nr:chemotaxis protein CheX [Carboxydothermus pertinax]GAV21501.1 CheC domain protein [Carboxydothermus pertinax]